MVLVKGEDYDIAFKRSDFNSQMDRLKLIIYINNKDSRGKNCSIDYDFDLSDYDLNVLRKVNYVEGRNQGR